MPTSTPASSKQWLKITFTCPSPLLESASDLLGVLSGSGVEQSPETESGAVLSGFFLITADASAETILTKVRAELGDLFAIFEQPLPQFDTSLLADEDWATSWQQYFKPFAIVPGLVIKPSWETYVPAPGEKIIEMDPGMAFGTGQHASTRMALALIQDSMRQIPVEKALDVGTGTGILAMAAILFGAGKAIAIDNDVEAVRVAGENIAHNKLSESIAVSATPVQEITGTFPLVIANIVHDVLVDMAPTLARLTAAGGFLVLAGILSGMQEENICRVYGELGFTPANRRYQDEWVSLQLRRD